jgi:L,D-transpeptidase ErfK/SrfK
MNAISRPAISRPTNSRHPLTALFAIGVLLSAATGAIAQTTVAPVPAAVAPVPVPVVQPAPSVLPPLAAPPAPVVQPAPQAEVVRLVLKRSQRRVFVYKNDKAVTSYPVAVGKPGWETPLGDFKVLNMEPNPIFKSFKSGRVIPPGPDNPLGVRWIGIWTDGKTQLGFHGTNEPELIGQAVSHGCIRMHNRDVVKLYEQVKSGVSVQVVP